MDTEGLRPIKAYIHLIHFPVYVLGPGIRVGLWFQGCTIRCTGCMSIHTWKFDKEYFTNIKEVINTINAFPTHRLTISGGEPFDQPEALLEILKGVRITKKDILVYTGYPYTKIKENYIDILKLIDVLIAGPFIKGKDSHLIWKGSDNQEMIILNDNLKDEYFMYGNLIKNKKLQLIEKRDKKYIIGIPYQRDWEVIQGAL